MRKWSNIRLVWLLEVLLVLCAVVVSNVQAQTLDKLVIYVWDFSTRNSEKNDLTTNLTNEFEEVLIQSKRCIILERRNYDRLLSQKDNEMAILNIEGISPTTLNTLKAHQANAVAFGEIYDDVESGQIKVTVIFQAFDGVKLAQQSILFSRGKRYDAESRTHAMKDLVRRILESVFPPPSLPPPQPSPKKSAINIKAEIFLKNSRQVKLDSFQIKVHTQTIHMMGPRSRYDVSLQKLFVDSGYKKAIDIKECKVIKFNPVEGVLPILFIRLTNNTEIRGLLLLPEENDLPSLSYSGYTGINEYFFVGFDEFGHEAILKLDEVDKIVISAFDEDKDTTKQNFSFESSFDPRNNLELKRLFKIPDAEKLDSKDHKIIFSDDLHDYSPGHEISKSKWLSSTRVKIIRILDKNWFAYDNKSNLNNASLNANLEGLSFPPNFEIQLNYFTAQASKGHINFWIGSGDIKGHIDIFNHLNHDDLSPNIVHTIRVSVTDENIKIYLDGNQYKEFQQHLNREPAYFSLSFGSFDKHATYITNILIRGYE